jgi:hypothetical protein
MNQMLEDRDARGMIGIIRTGLNIGARRPRRFASANEG